MKIFPIIFILLCSFFLFAREHVAIIDFENIGVSKNESKALTQKLTTEMIKIGEYIVLERSEMKKVLDEQKFQYSGCIDINCAVQIGRMIGAKYMIVGSVSKVGKTFSVDSRLINVETAESYGGGDFSHTGEVDYLLTEGMKSIAYQLSDIKYEPKPPPPTKTIIDFTPSTQIGNHTIGGHLIVDTTPHGANVFIDGSLLGITPIEISNYPVGEYKIGLELNQHHVFKEYEKFTFYVQDIKIVPYATLKIFEEFKCSINIDCDGKCGGKKILDECGVCGGNGIEDGKCDCDGNVLDCFNLCGGNSKLDECNICNGHNLDKDCNGVCFGGNNKKEYCFDSNGDGDGDIKTKKILCPNEVKKNWVNNCQAIQGEFLINTQIKNLTYLKIGGRNIMNQTHPIKLPIGKYELLAKSNYFLKEFTISKYIEIFEDEITTISINDNEIKVEKDKHRKLVKYSSGSAFALWLIWGLLPYDM